MYSTISPGRGVDMNLHCKPGEANAYLITASSEAGLVTTLMCISENCMWSLQILEMAARCVFHKFFFLYMFLANQWFISHNFLLCRPSQRSARSQVPTQPSAIPGGNPPDNRQSAVGWGFEPGTAGQQSDALPPSHHASHILP